ncbi:isochorismatase family protein [Mycoplasmopsis cynos]|uniref:isochorismatase family protein n=1 Tax=Mycoplasmopsis cynos TaxID=171284 RepID=UPI0024CA0203|nr:isochorismatase family protein [Mycoplasmopsis cynos]WAM04493.1 isochorismatase family protein [Mycoplasmopsis cynos]
MKKSVVFVIDVLKGFLEKGNLADHRIQKIVPIIKEILNHNPNIFFVCDAHSTNDLEMTQYPVHCLKDTEESKVVEKLNIFVKQDNSNVIYKNTTNSFFHIDKSIYNEYDEFIIVGCCTDICILQFCLTLKVWLNKENIDKKIIVYDNAVETFHNENHNGDMMHRYALELMKNRNWNKNMRIEVDLHGLESQEALIKIQEYVFDLLENRYQKIIFITGNGSGALKATLENFINNHNKHSKQKIKSTLINNGSYQLEVYYDFDLENEINDNNYYDNDVLNDKMISQRDVDNIFNEWKSKFKK